jgi:hypothetical protein
VGDFVGSDYSVIRNSLFEHLKTNSKGLVLIAGESDRSRSSLLGEVAILLNLAVINLSLVISSELKDLSKSERPFRAAKAIAEIARNDCPLILDHIETLFDPQLKVIPLETLRSLAKKTIVLANWPGRFDGNTAIYGRRGHPEFREERLCNETIFKID